MRLKEDEQRRAALKDLPLFLFYRINCLKELPDVRDLYIGRVCLGFAADHINRRSLVDSNPVAEVAVGVNLCGQLALRIKDKRQIYFVIGGKFFRERAQVARIDFQLMLKNIVAKIIA